MFKLNKAVTQFNQQELLVFKRTSQSSIYDINLYF